VNVSPTTLGGKAMGIWIELGVFLLVFVFAAHQMHDLKKEKKKREAEKENQKEEQLTKVDQNPNKQG
jgi:predicted membrane protein